MARKRTICDLSRVDFRELPQFMRISEFIDRVDKVISDRQLRRYIKDGRLPTYVLDGSNISYIGRDDVQKLVEEML